MAATTLGRATLGSVAGRASLGARGVGPFNGLTVRNFSYQFDFRRGSSRMPWPRSMVNTMFCICPQGENMVIERFGKKLYTQEPGLFFAIPLVDRIAYRVDMREQAIEIPPQSTITKDNVTVDVSGCLYVKFEDAEKAAYGSSDPIYAVTQFAQSTMRAAIGEMELDEMLHARTNLNNIIRQAVQEGAEPWGLSIKRYEITDVRPDEAISKAMDKQAASERERREKITGAKADKEEMLLASEGTKLKLINESEGELQKLRNEAEGRKDQVILEATAEAESIRLKAAAQAEAVQTIADALQKTQGSEEAVKVLLATDYIEMYSRLGASSNTMLFQDRPADLNALLAQASTILKNSPSSSSS